MFATPGLLRPAETDTRQRQEGLPGNGRLARRFVLRLCASGRVWNTGMGLQQGVVHKGKTRALEEAYTLIPSGTQCRALLPPYQSVATARAKGARARSSPMKQCVFILRSYLYMLVTPAPADKSQGLALAVLLLAAKTPLLRSINNYDALMIPCA